MTKSIYTIILSLLCAGAYAQNEIDALNLSQTDISGTARSAALSGAGSAMGADPTSMYTNPAGLGLFRSSEVSITPVLQLQSIDSDFGGYSAKENSSRFSINNASYVGTTYLSSSGLKTITYGVGYNRLANFFVRTRISASNLNTSLLDSWAADISDWGGFNTLSPNDMTNTGSDYYYSNGAMAYRQYLINPSNNSNYYISEMEYAGYGQNIGRTKRTTGALGEWDFSIAGNIDDKLFLGLTLGVQDINYGETVEHYEDGGYSLIDYYRYFEYYDIDGYGVNLKFGLIYRPVNAVRLGFAYHSPTWMNLSNSYAYSLESRWLDYAFTDQQQLSSFDDMPYSFYDYKMRTPGKIEVGATFQFGQFGLLNVDYEYIDYTQMQYKSCDGYDQLFYDEINDIIDDTYQAVSNVRIGAEFRIDPLVTARLGYAYYGNPYSDDSYLYKDNSYQNFSAGLGYRTESFYLDLAYIHTFRKDYYWMYSAPDIGNDSWDTIHYGADTESNNGRILLTAGFRF